jgi:hypothetical protein
VQRVWRAVVRRLGEHRAGLVELASTEAAQRQLVGGLVEALRRSVGIISTATVEVAATHPAACERGGANPRSPPSQPAHPGDAQAEAEAMECTAAEVLALLLVEHHRNVRPAVHTVVTEGDHPLSSRCVRRVGDRDSHCLWLRAETHAHARRALLLPPARAFMRPSTSEVVAARARPTYSCRGLFSHALGR